MSQSGSDTYHTAPTHPSADDLASQLNSVYLEPSSSGSSQMRSAPSRKSESPDEAARKMQVRRLDMPDAQQDFALRPISKVEDTGLVRTFPVKSNFYKLKMDTKISCYHYALAFYNDKRLPMTRREETSVIFWHVHNMLTTGNNQMLPPYFKCIFDGVNALYTLEEAKIRGSLQEFKVQVNRKWYVMTILFTGKKEIPTNPQTVDEKTQLTFFIDAVLTAKALCPYNADFQLFARFGQNIFFNGERSDRITKMMTVPLGEGLVAFAGMYGAVKPQCEAGILYNVDTRFSVFYRKGFPLIHFYVEIETRKTFEEYVAENGPLERCGMNFDQRRRLETRLKGIRCTYNRPVQTGTSEKSFKFTNLSDKSARAMMMTVENEGTMSVCDFFQCNFGYTLKYPDLPLVALGAFKRNAPRPRAWVPMELVTTSAEAKKFKGQVTESLRAKMVRNTAYTPTDRALMIDHIVDHRNESGPLPQYISTEDEFSNAAEISLDKTPITVKASLLNAPTLKFGNSSFDDPDNVGEWQLSTGSSLRQIISEKIAIIPAVIFMTPQKGAAGTRYDGLSVEPLKTLMHTLLLMGAETPGQASAWQIREGKNFQEFDCYKDSWEVMLQAMEHFKQGVAKHSENAKPLLIVVFKYRCSTRIQENDGYESEYRMIKYLANKAGIYSQCLLSRTWDALVGNPESCSTAHNVALKILAKMGATLHKIDAERSPSWKILTNPEEPTLVLGLDVTHPGRDDREKKGVPALSVASVVGNTDIEISKWEVTNRVQRTGEEHVVALEREFKERILAFHKGTGKLPAHIIIFRDGIGESQFQKILYEEKHLLESTAVFGIILGDLRTIWEG